MPDAHSRPSPMLEQYGRIKRENPGSVLFFRLGDFYEMFADDAVEVSALLNLTLTSRNGLPMCGVPYHAARSYIGRLLRHGKKIAVCEQVAGGAGGEGAEGRGRKVMERQVVEVVTPGTAVDEDYLDGAGHNYLACLCACGGAQGGANGGALSLAYIDLSAGSFCAASFPAGDPEGRLGQELERLQAREIIAQESLVEGNPAVARALADRPEMALTRRADWLFDMDGARKRLERQLGVAGLKGFGLAEGSPEILSAGALLEYLDGTARSLLPHIRSISVHGDGEFVGIDEASQRNLEIARNLRDGSAKFTLLESVDETCCAMGRRLLLRRLLRPLRDIAKIQARLDMVETLFRDPAALGDLRGILAKMPDLERLSSRLAMDRARGKDLLAIKGALGACEAMRDLRGSLGLRCELDGDRGDAPPPGGGGEGGGGFGRLMELRDLLERGICAEPAAEPGEGSVIREGYSAELDGLRGLRDSGRRLLEDYLEEERAATGIHSLKMRYNRLIGYFFEVTKAQLPRVPGHFVRRQGVVGGERFSTGRLAALESDINGAAEKIAGLERALFLEIRERAKAELEGLAAEAARAAELDAAQSLARAASLRGWARPELDGSGALEIRAARHPVVEAHLGGGEFVPNDIALGSGPGAPTFAMITGPNMAGKSTYLRSAALIALMAQAGSFIPAASGRIGICDRIFCRVGASDNLARGESTFLVEMSETACILNTATEKSLVIMDEVGRGTGTNDGLSIAWAVSEELLGRIGCRTLFATHYHELSLLRHPRGANRSMEVLEKDGQVIFLRRLREGPASESYGLHVARLAGLPKPALERARRVMERLRERDSGLRQALPEEPLPEEAPMQEAPAGEGALPSGASGDGRKGKPPFSPPEEGALPPGAAEVLRAICLLDPDRIAPIEALALLAEWKRALGGSGGAGFGGSDSAAFAAGAQAGGAGQGARQRGGGRGDAGPSLFD